MTVAPSGGGSRNLASISVRMSVRVAYVPVLVVNRRRVGFLPEETSFFWDGGRNW